MKSGTCGKCSSNEVYTNRNLPNRGERNLIAVSSTKWFFLTTYLCLNCGNFEEFISEDELKDEKLMAKLKSTWEKI